MPDQNQLVCTVKQNVTSLDKDASHHRVVDRFIVFCRQRLVARNKDRKERNKLKKQIEEIQEKLDKERKKKEKYKKRCQCLKKYSASLRSKVNELTANCPVNPKIRKTLLYHQSLIQDIRNKYQHATKDRERQLIAKVTTGRIVKKNTGCRDLLRVTWIFK